jgi:Rod binding domain-containing protein
MTAPSGLLAPGLDARLAAARTAYSGARKAGDERDPKLLKQARDFESLFLETSFGHLTAGLGGDGPLGGGSLAQETWRGMLTQEYARNIVKHGGVGLADAVYRELVKLQGQHGSSGGAHAA